nr:BCCT family transporter [Halomonas huangheensis]
MGKPYCATSRSDLCIFQCIIEGAIAIALLLGGGPGGLQAATVATGLPFTLVLLCLLHNHQGFAVGATRSTLGTTLKQ